MIGRRLARVLYPYGSVRRVLRGENRGNRYVASTAMGLSYSLGLGEFGFGQLTAYLKGCGDIVDVGANQGQFSIFFASAIHPDKERLLSLEPVASQFCMLETNVRLNSFRHVIALQVAASDHAGVAMMQFDEASPTQGSLAAEGGGQEVRCQTIDTLCSEHGLKPKLIKIDVEGHGAAVLRGARRVILDHAPVILIEFHNAEEREAVAGLKDFGYQVLGLRGRKPVEVLEDWTANPVVCLR